MIQPQRRNTALLVAGCFFMEMLDGTIVTTAAPKMAEALHVRPSEIGLVVTAYLLALAVLIPVSAWVTARWGERRVFLAAIVLFTLGSVGCALSRTLWQIVVLRVVQGAGGAMMVPVGRLVVLRNVEKGDLLRLMSYVVWPGLIAPVVAPLVGGLLTSYASWRWIFLINVPLGAVALVVARRLIRDGDRLEAPPLDRRGVVLTCGGLGTLTYAAHVLSQPRPDGAALAVAAVAAAALLAAAAVHLLRAPAPLLNLRTLHVATFRSATAGIVWFWLPVIATPFLLPLLFQTVFGWSAVKSGAVVLFVFAGNIGIKPLTTPLLRRWGFRANLVLAGGGLAATVAAFGLFTRATPLAAIALVVLLSGVFRSIGFTAYNTMAYADVPEREMRDANALNATAQQVAAGLGVAAASVALRIGGAAAGVGRTAYAVAFGLLALAGVGAALGALRLAPEAGEALRRPRPS